MVKSMVIAALIAFPAGWGVSYFATSHQGEKTLKVYKKQVEENIENRRVRVCREVEGVLPENRELAVRIILDEVEEMNRRKVERRWENESY